MTLPLPSPPTPDTTGNAAAGAVSGLLTFAQAAALLGKSTFTIRTYCRRGELQRANAGGKGIPALFRPEDLRRIQAARERFWTEKRGPAIISDTGRICNKCRKWKAFSQFHKCPGRTGGVQTICKACHCKQYRAYYRETVYPKRRNATGWLAKYRNPKTAGHREYRRLLVAIEDGKTGPFTKRDGFALVRGELDEGGARFYRAARLDVRLVQGERAVARYEPYAGGRWLVYAAPLAREADNAFIRKLQKREGKA